MTTSPDRLAAVERMLAAADKIDNRLGPIPGSDADYLAVLLRNAAESLKAALADRDAAWRDGVEAAARIVISEKHHSEWAYVHDATANAIAEAIRALQPADRTPGKEHTDD